jgi:hypothetical protein
MEVSISASGLSRVCSAPLALPEQKGPVMQPPLGDSLAAVQLAQTPPGSRSSSIFDLQVSRYSYLFVCKSYVVSQVR